MRSRNAVQQQQPYYREAQVMLPPSQERMWERHGVEPAMPVYAGAPGTRSGPAGLHQCVCLIIGLCRILLCSLELISAALPAAVGTGASWLIRGWVAGKSCQRRIGSNNITDQM